MAFPSARRESADRTTWRILRLFPERDFGLVEKNLSDFGIDQVNPVKNHKSGRILFPLVLRSFSKKRNSFLGFF
ncbi:hypothetical protein CH380_11605 [Leptospira adleri]|uniref:Uncharacterized protein n=1 Tax=Leptospira adleri TaxID=2023186 RepID=A0A2M9YND2_9LEPT|nr:hypothetical protein CH380_11605 [Leptospira adleri]PJZ62613.1 hypothetical protein CH376_07385 [Leptospira adleri]